jgi:hypothetical protein
VVFASILKTLQVFKFLPSTSELIASDQFTSAILLRACRLPLAVTFSPRNCMSFNQRDIRAFKWSKTLFKRPLNNIQLAVPSVDKV